MTEQLGAPLECEKLAQKLKILYRFVKPYRLPLIFAILSLTLAAVMTLSLGWGLRYLIDVGFQDQNAGALDSALLFMGLAVVLLAIASFGRSYFVGWVVGTHDNKFTPTSL